MSKSLLQPEETYRATYRGSTIVIAHANEHVSRPVALRMASEISWMQKGDINVQLHTLHASARRELMRHMPSNVFAERDRASHLQHVPEMIRTITADRRYDIEELIVLSKMPGFRNGRNAIMPLLSNSKIDAMKHEHPDDGDILSAVEDGLQKTPKIVFTQPQFLGDEIRSVTGKGTMCFNRNATTYSPLFVREIPIFMENYRRNVDDGTYRPRSKEELEKIRDEHHGIRAGRSIIAGFSLTPRDRRRLSLELFWGASRGGDLGSLILDHATKEAAQSSYYTMTVRDAVAHIFREYPGMKDYGRMSDLQKSGDINIYAPEHVNYDTTTRDPYFFWHQGQED